MVLRGSSPELPRDDLAHEVDSSLTGQFVNLLRLPRAAHPETEKFILHLDNAAHYKKALVPRWLKRHPEFRLVFLPASSPNLNLIERLWKFPREEALSCWHKTFKEMRAAVSCVLDHLHEYREELDTRVREEFQILRDEDLPVTSAVAAYKESSPLRSAVP